MAQQRYSKVLQRTALSAALGLCFASATYAQSNSTGAIFGQAEPGATVTINNPATGFSRTQSASSDGSYRFSALPVGSYDVTASSADGASQTREDIFVQLGTGAQVSFTGLGPTTTLDVMTVVGSGFINPIDVSSVESSTVFTAEQVEKIPVSRDITSVALLAPGTVQGDSAFGNLASFGGSAVNENQYFLNGFNITNTFKNLNFVKVPYGGIAQQQVKTGGYGAEFGRSTGGVLNLVTKRGTNDFKAGAAVFWEPESLQEQNPDLIYNDGAIVSRRSYAEDQSMDYSVWAGGALVEDTLFAYGIIGYGTSESTSSFPGSPNYDGNNSSSEQTAPTWLLKLDWNINDSNLIEFTAFDDSRETESDFYETEFDSNDLPTRGDYLGTEYTERGGLGYFAKYTGYLTDNFTISALAGHAEFSRSNYAITASGVEERYQGNLFGPVAGCPIVSDLRPQDVITATGRIVGCSFAGRLGRVDNMDERDQFRIDAEWFLGDHQVRFGYDSDDFTSVDGSAYEGGALIRYQQTSAGTDYVRIYDIRQGATVGAESQAFYIEDTWHITQNFLLYGGLRWDSFDNLNGEDEAYVSLDNQLGPRLGFSWDITGDSANKLFANAGRYFLPLTTNVAVRSASRSLYKIQDFYYDGIDPVTKAPLNLVPCDVCAFTEPYFANGESGQVKNAATYAAANLEPMYQDEYILGFQHQFNPNVTAGIRATYRSLETAIDDTCDLRPFIRYANENDLNLTINPALQYCHIYNPGIDPVFIVDIDGDGNLETVEVSSEELGPDAKRTYKAVELFAEGNWEDFFVQGSYTWSESKGNTEGGVKSDIGQDDTGVTQDFDYPELGLGSYGYLPNDRRHALKVFGQYAFTDEWAAGFNVNVHSGRPINCIGVYGDDPTGYGSAYFSCDDEPVDTEDENTPEIEDQTPGGENNGTTIVPRGSVGTTSWVYALNLSLEYSPSWVEGLQFKVDVFNVLNDHTETSVNEFGEDDDGLVSRVADSYLTPASYQAPRSVRFMVKYDF